MDNRVGLNLLYAQVRDLTFQIKLSWVCEKPASFCSHVREDELLLSASSDCVRHRTGLDTGQQRPAPAAEIPAGERLQERSEQASPQIFQSLQARRANGLWGHGCLLLPRICCLISGVKELMHLLSRDSNTTLSSFLAVHSSWSDSEILRLHQVWPLCHRLPWEGLPGDRQRRQQRAQLPRQVAQRADEGGELQGHPHEVLASHVFCKCVCVCVCGRERRRASSPSSVLWNNYHQSCSTLSPEPVLNQQMPPHWRVTLVPPANIRRPSFCWKCWVHHPSPSIQLADRAVSTGQPPPWSGVLSPHRGKSVADEQIWCSIRKRPRHSVGSGGPWMNGSYVLHMSLLLTLSAWC